MGRCKCSISQISWPFQPGAATPLRSTTPGASALARAQILLYVPDDTLHNPAVLVYSAIPQWTPGAEIAFQRGVEYGIPLSAECFEDSNGNTLQIGRLSDLSLT